MKLTREQVLAEIRRIAEENGGKAPGQKRFASQTDIQSTNSAGSDRDGLSRFGLAETHG